MSYSMIINELFGKRSQTVVVMDASFNIVLVQLQEGAQRVPFRAL